MSKEILEAVRGLAAEKNISAEKLMEALEDALLSAYKKTPGSAPYGNDRESEHEYQCEDQNGKERAPLTHDQTRVDAVGGRTTRRRTRTSRHREQICTVCARTLRRHARARGVTTAVRLRRPSARVRRGLSLQKSSEEILEVHMVFQINLGLLADVRILFVRLRRRFQRGQRNRVLATCRIGTTDTAWGWGSSSSCPRVAIRRHHSARYCQFSAR